AYAEDYEALQPLQELATKYELAILVVHHTNKRFAKELDDIFDSVSGSTGLTGSADAILLLARKRGEFDAILHVTGRDLEEQELGLQVDRATNAWRLLGKADAVQMSEERRKIYLALSNSFEPLSPREIAKKADMNGDCVRQLLGKMLEDGQVRSDIRGKYT